MRRAARIDDNQQELVKQLRRMGCSVFSTAQLGNGFPDLVVGFAGVNYMFEVKDPGKSPSKRKLTKDEQEFHDKWRGGVFVIETLEDALKVIMRIR